MAIFYFSKSFIKLDPRQPISKRYYVYILFIKSKKNIDW